MAKISRTQILNRLDSLEITIAGLKTLTPVEIKELDAAVKLFKESGEFASNKYGDFLKRFEEVH